MGHGHPPHRRVRGSEHEDREGEEKGHEVDGAEPGRAMASRATAERHQSVSDRAHEHHGRHGEQVSDARIDPHLQQPGVGHEPGDTGGSGHRERPSLGRPQ